MPPRPHQGFCPHPCSCHPPSGLPHLLFQIDPPHLFIQPVPLIHPRFSLPSCTGCLDSKTLILVLVMDPHSDISRNHSRHTCQSVCQLSVLWQSSNQPDHCSTHHLFFSLPCHFFFFLLQKIVSALLTYLLLAACNSGNFN